MSEQVDLRIDGTSSNSAIADHSSHSDQDLYDKIANLLDILSEKDAQVAILADKVGSLTTLLNIAAPLEPPLAHVAANKAKPSAKAMAKLEFYKAYKDSPEVKEQVELFKKTFPQIKKPPWQFIKAVTDAMFAKNVGVL